MKNEGNAEAKIRTYSISLRPYQIVHLLCIRKTLMNVQRRGGTKSTKHVKKTRVRQRVCQLTLSVIPTTTNRWVYMDTLCVSDYKENDGNI